MDILVLNYEYPPLGGGAAPVCRSLAAGMARSGHRVTVVTMGFGGLPAHETAEGVEIFRLKCLRTKEHSCMPWEQYSYILAARRFLKSHLPARSYDVCHTHFVIPTGPIARWAKTRYGLPYVITAHGSDVEGHNDKTCIKLLHRLLRPAWRRIVRDSYAVTAPSAYLLALMDRELPGGPYRRIPNGLDISRFRSDRSGKEKRILLTGRLQEAKNLQTVIRAMALIPEKAWGEWSADVLGDGPYRAELEKLCRGLGIEDRVRFRGWIENGSSEHLDYLKRASVYISASRFENCPMAVLEAMAAGCYPLLSDIEGHRQFFENGAACFFPPEDAETLAGKLRELLGKRPEDLLPPAMDLTAFDGDRVTGDMIRLLEKAAGKEEGEENG